MARGEAVGDRMNLLLQEKTKRDRILALRRDTIRKIEFVRKKAIIEHREVYRLIHDFFKEFLEQRYEFTTNELRIELKKVYITSTTRQQIHDLLETLQAIEYANVHYEKEDLHKILTAFEQIVKQLVHMHTARKSLWQHLKELFTREHEPETILADLPVRTDNDAAHIRIHTLVERCYIALDHHQMRKAKAGYQQLLEEYASLDDARKKHYYHLIEQTYHDIMNRSKMTQK